MKRTAPVGGLLLLCLLWAGAALRSDLLPVSGGAGAAGLAGQAIALALFALAAGLAALLRRAEWPSGRQLAAAAMVGIGLFAAPALVLEFARVEIGDSTRVALFSLTPVFAVVLEPYFGAGGERRGGLAAGLTAVAGTLLLFPLDLPQTAAAALAWGAVIAAVIGIAAANCFAVRMVCTQTAGELPGFAAVAAGCAAFLVGAAGVVMERKAAVRVDIWIVVEMASLALLFGLMRHLSAVRMTTRFVIAPLMANLIGLAFLRPTVNLRDWAGLLLIALGAGWLLLARDDEPERTGSSLEIT